MITQIKEYFRMLVLNWSFIFGILTATVLFSDYIFGDDNLYEEIVELAHKIISGKDVDLSPKTTEHDDLNKLFEIRSRLKQEL